MKNSWDFDDYKAIDEIRNKSYILPVSFILLIVGIIILYKFNFYTYEKYSLIKVEDYFSVIVSSDEINFIESNNCIYINNSKYNYRIIKVDSNYNNIDNIIYQTVYIDIDNYSTEAFISNSYILKNKGTLLNRIIKFITGGIG